jgi:hypothetical protein
MFALRLPGRAIELAAPDTCIPRTQNVYASAKAALLSICQSTALVRSASHDWPFGHGHPWVGLAMLTSCSWLFQAAPF